MRSELKSLGTYRRYTFIATFERYGSRENRFSYYPEITLLFLNIIHKDSGRKVADHIWIKSGKRFDDMGELKKGDKIQFDARVDEYVKGYIGRKAEENGEAWTQRDWRLSFPTKIIRIERQEELNENLPK
jgi:hypothetical protein